MLMAKKLVSRTSARSQVNMTEMVLPNHTNALGTIFGGVLMSWIDIAAAISAQRYCGMTCVTASVDDLHFLRPVRLGQIVNIQAKVTSVHKTSCEVTVNVEGEDTMAGTVFRIARAQLTFVALDDNRSPTAMPPLKVVGSEQLKLQKDAEARRRLRLKIKQQLKDTYASL
jgi:acyl-CoA hydrolase